ncbi:mau2 chromatid cohesion factor [Batrachochytrium dendrobatidis]|nr:mau2 chromatid cohesion factor [Batrachochytrium dendrobatidis]KAK5673596.1 mau2 chromatid cohesion factor [Batrachochytrium dendrobatidis]
MEASMETSISDTVAVKLDTRVSTAAINVPITTLHPQHLSIALLQMADRLSITAQQQLSNYKSLLVSGTDATLQHSQMNAAASIRCYEALLSPSMLSGQTTSSASGHATVPSTAMTTWNRVSPTIEAQARLGLAQVLWLFTKSDQVVEQHLIKSILLAEKLTNSHHIYFQILDLRLTISEARKNQKYSIQIFKQATEKSIELKLYSWYFYFVARRLNLHESQKEWGAYLNTVQKAIVQAKSINDIETMARLVASQIKIKLLAGSVKSVQSSINEFEQVLTRLQSLDTPASVSLQSINSLFLLKQMAVIILNLRSGNHKEAINLLASMHALVEQIDTTGFKQLQLLAYLLSGIAHKPDDNFKAKAFLTEGLRLANVAYGAYDAKTNSEIGNIKVVFITQLSQVYIMRSGYSEACELLNTGMQWCTRSDILVGNNEYHLKFGWAQLLQALELNTPSSILFSQIENCHQNQIEKSTLTQNLVLAQLGWLTPFHRYIMSYSANPREIVNVLIPNEASFKTRAFASLLQGCLKANIGNTQQAKQHILESFKLAGTTMSLHHRVVCLVMLASLFQLSEPEQAEKMASTALALSKRAHSEPLLACCMTLLSFVASQKGETEKAKTLSDGANQRVCANQSAILSARKILPECIKY